MLIISQNLSNYDFNVPKNSVFRINLAWINNIDELVDILKKHGLINILKLTLKDPVILLATYLVNLPKLV